MTVALMPCHREPPAEQLVRRVLAELPELVIVDDGMPPAAGIALDALASRCGAQALHLPRHLGKGHAIAAGLRAVCDRTPAPAAIMVLDSDGQHPPEAIPDFLAASAVADLVIGNRFAGGARGMPIVRHLSNRAASAVVSLSSRSPVPDSQCGMRLLGERALAVGFPAGGMEAETRHLKRCLAAGLKLAWVPIPAIYAGQLSSFRTVRDSVAVMRAAYSSERRNGPSSSATTFSSAGQAGSAETSDSTTRPSSKRAVT
jgi:hypothetical protein